MLKSEIKTIPEAMFLERGNLEWMIYQEEEKLAALEHTPEPPKTLKLTFRGEAVNGTESINAKFISNVSSSFTDIIAFFNKGFKKNDGSQLIIKDIVRGSFGFEFEAFHGNQLTLLDNNTELSLAKFQEYLEHFLNDSEEELDTFLIDVKPTLISKMTNFLTINSKHESWFVSNFAGKELATKNKEEIDTIISKISIPADENEITLEGSFHGCLLSAMRVDFVTGEETYTIKLASGIQEDQAEAILKNDKCSAKIRLKQVTRGGRKPKYLLENFADISYINE
jgi:hypothetical protein